MQHGKQTVAVVGGGYGGAAVAKALDEAAHVVLVEPRDSFAHSAGSLRALVRPEWAENIFFSYDKLLTHGTVVRDRAATVDERGVELASGERVDVDFMVLATGSGYPFPAKTVTDSTADALQQLRGAAAELDGAERVLIAGAGPVGLELSGEIKAVWPEKQVTIVDPASELLPGFEPELRAELHRQLDAIGIEVRLGTSLDELPSSEPGTAGAFTVTAAGAKIEADIWFRAFGVSTNSGYLADGRIANLNAKGQLPVTPKLNVEGHQHIYALGDLTDLPEAKMAANAMKHAEVVAANIIAQVGGAAPESEYHPSPVPAVLLPLGPEGGVGQIPSEDGPSLLPAEAVAEWKGRDLMVGRFAELFGTA